MSRKRRGGNGGGGGRVALCAWGWNEKKERDTAAMHGSADAGGTLDVRQRAAAQAGGEQVGQMESKRFQTKTGTPCTWMANRTGQWFPLSTRFSGSTRSADMWRWNVLGNNTLDPNHKFVRAQRENKRALPQVSTVASTVAGCQCCLSWQAKISFPYALVWHCQT